MAAFWQQREAISHLLPKPEEADPASPVPVVLHNPYAGKASAWQLDETVDAFLARLPPSRITVTEVDWIFICNPYAGRKLKEGVGKVTGGKDDEDPVEEDSRLEHFIEGGTAFLDVHDRFLEPTRGKGRLPTKIKREVVQATDEAAANILALAVATNIRHGKVRPWL